MSAEHKPQRRRFYFLCWLGLHDKWWRFNGDGDFKCFRCGLEGNDGGPLHD